MSETTFQRPKARVLIECVTHEIAMSVQSALECKAERVHLINYIDTKEPKREQFYRKAYGLVKEQLEKEGIKVIEHCEAKTYVFKDMLKTIYPILKEESINSSELHVNISGGTNEYAAAATMASMMFEKAKVFSVGVDRDYRTLDIETFEKTLKDKEGNLVGSTTKISGPYDIDAFPIPSFETELLKELKVFSTFGLKDSTCKNVLEKIIEQGLWKHSVVNPDDPFEGTSYRFAEQHSTLKGDDKDKYQKLAKKEAVQYKTYCVDVWLEKQWIEPVEGFRDKYRVTSIGKAYLDIFCQDGIDGE